MQNFMGAYKKSQPTNFSVPQKLYEADPSLLTAMQKAINKDNEANPGKRNRSLMDSLAAPVQSIAQQGRRGDTQLAGGLSPEQTQALKAQISYNESRGDYGAVNRFNYLGRYQVSGAVLQDQGLLHADYVKKYGNKAALYPAAWTSKAHGLGITSQADFLSNSAVQEQVMDNLLVSNSKRLSQNGGVRTGDDAGTVGGMLQTAHLLGAKGAMKWRNGGGGADANGTTGVTYFNRGKDAVDNPYLRDGSDYGDYGGDYGGGVGVGVDDN